MKLPTLLPLLLAASCAAQVGPFFPLHASGAAPIAFTKSRPSQFTHPGLLHTSADLSRIRTKLATHSEPWSTEFAALQADTYSSPSWVPSPAAVVVRGVQTNNSALIADSRAAYQNALLYALSNATAHADAAARILDAWGTTLTTLGGLDAALMAGLEGFLLANAAELLRHSPYAWRESGAAYTGTKGFSGVLYRVFAPPVVAVGQANYGLAMIRAQLAFAVYLDDVVMYNAALNSLQNDYCAGFAATIHPTTGQLSESGRDQGHVQGGLAWMADAAKVVAAQGGDMWRWNDALLLKGVEYAAKYNLGADVPYDADWYRCEAVLVDGPWSEVSERGRGKLAPVWTLPVQVYRALGRSVEWASRVVANGSYVERGTTSSDFTGWGKLVYTLE
ncbi:chondroitin AC/alginate lyase [Geopyxis carbonaria]|nr:chondroitin AC/alginate lyase [Geopyxis carbonaria]